MIVHLVFFKLSPEVDAAGLGRVIAETERQLAAIGPVVSVRSGKNIESDAEWPFYLEVTVGSLADLEAYRVDPLHVRYVEEIIKPNTTDRLALDYEVES